MHLDTTQVIVTWFEPRAFPFLLSVVGVLQEEGRVQAVLARVGLKLDAEKEDWIWAKVAGQVALKKTSKFLDTPLEWVKLKRSQETWFLPLLDPNPRLTTISGSPNGNRYGNLIFQKS